MPTLSWATDVHLNFVPPAAAAELAAELARLGPDGIVISGDIAEAPDVLEKLEALAAAAERPVYFVLGNHDYYRGSIAGVRARLAEAARGPSRLRWLNQETGIDLGGGWGLVGHDGWGDARAGDPEGSRVALSDWIHIEELRLLPDPERNRRLRALGDEVAAHFSRVVPGALDRFEKLLVATHVPPFPEACWHEGRMSAPDWLPWFTCVAGGEALRQAMASRPDRRMLVVCGHTHGGGEVDILPNLRVLTGAADYGAPAAQRPLELT
jgi:3',5'-cyclic-AMP phosphodiesterase